MICTRIIGAVNLCSLVQHKHSLLFSELHIDICMEEVEQYNDNNTSAVENNDGPNKNNNA